jgi:succinate dehydrogenase / fumarate reductase, membrane anchor subunit
MSLRDPLAKVRGLGSAREGVAHWWAQRLTAVLLIPLSIWFLCCVARFVGADYPDARVFLAQPLNAFLLMAFVVTLLYHGMLGVQVVIEDYIHTRALELGLQILVKLIVFLCALGTVYALIRITLGA